MAEERIEIGVYGTKEAIQALQLRAGAVQRGARIAMSGTTLRILSRIKRSFGQAGKPQRRTGHLSRSMIRLVIDESGAIVGIVGSTLPYKTGYAAILEKGGPLPAMTITPKKARALRWFTGFRGIAFQAALARGSTIKGAVKAARAGNLGRGRGGRGADVAFARSVKIPARYQRAMPYMRPAYDEERPLIPITFTREIRKQLGLEEISAGLGEG